MGDHEKREQLNGSDCCAIARYRLTLKLPTAAVGSQRFHLSACCCNSLFLCHEFCSRPRMVGQCGRHSRDRGFYRNVKCSTRNAGSWYQGLYIVIVTTSYERKKWILRRYCSDLFNAWNTVLDCTFSVQKNRFARRRLTFSRLAGQLSRDVHFCHQQHWDRNPTSFSRFATFT